MQKLYFEEQKSGVQVLNKTGNLLSIVSDGILYVEEIKYIVDFNIKNKKEKIAFYLNNRKLFLKISYANGSKIDKITLKQIIFFLFGKNIAYSEKNNFAIIPLKAQGKYTEILKKIQNILNIVSDIGENENQSANPNQQQISSTNQTQTGNQTQQATNAQNNQSQENQVTKNEETKEKIAETILNNFKTKITDQKMMTSVNNIDFNKKDDNDLNSLYVKYLTYLYLNKPEFENELEKIKTTIKAKKGKSSKGLPPKAFISKYGKFIFSGLSNAENIEKITKDINTYFENEEDYDFFGELKRTDLFLERYLKG